MSMSVSSSAANLSQMMAAFLARIKASEQASQTSAATTTATATATDANATPPADSCNAASSASEPTLSDQVISALVAMQMQNGAASSATADPSATSSTDASGTGNDPIAQAFSALDTNGDGSISQSELETGIENVGGTSDEADAIFSALGGSSSTGISESGFASAAQAGAPPGGPGGPGGAHGHHHHHHGGGSSSAANDSSQIFSAIDSNDDGSISEDELASALGLGTDSTTDASGSTTSTTSTSDSSTAATQFSAIDTNGDGSISQDELKTYLGNLQQTATADQATINSLLQLANQSYSQSLSLMDPSSIGSSSTV